MKLNKIPVQLAVVTLFCTSLGFPQTQAKPAARGDLIRRRMEWYYRQRAYPLKHIPGDARLKALKQLDQMLAAEVDVASAPISSVLWTLIGPEPTDTPYSVPVVAGRVTALAVDPTNSTSCTRAAPTEECGRPQTPAATGLP